MSQDSPFNPTCLISWKHFVQLDALSALVNTDFFPCWPFTLLPLSIRSKMKSLISGSVVCGVYKTLCKHAFRHPLQFSLTALLFFSCTDSAQITTKLAWVAPTGHHNALPFIIVCGSLWCCSQISHPDFTCQHSRTKLYRIHLQFYLPWLRLIFSILWKKPPSHSSAYRHFCDRSNSVLAAVLMYLAYFPTQNIQFPRIFLSEHLHLKWSFSSNSLLSLCWGSSFQEEQRLAPISTSASTIQTSPCLWTCSPAVKHQEPWKSTLEDDPWHRICCVWHVGR